MRMRWGALALSKASATLCATHSHDSVLLHGLAPSVPGGLCMGKYEPTSGLNDGKRVYRLRRDGRGDMYLFSVYDKQQNHMWAGEACDRSLRFHLLTSDCASGGKCWGSRPVLPEVRYWFAERIVDRHGAGIHSARAGDAA
jgi:hypothetical protein